jgi:hypothetical protein
MLRFVLILLLSVLIFIPSMNRVFIVITFKMDQDRIAEKLCVKKEVANNTCKGQCYLKKQLDKTDKKKPNPERLIDSRDMLFICEPISIQSKVVFYWLQKNIENLWRIKGLGAFNSVFQPPEFIALGS